MNVSLVGRLARTVVMHHDNQGSQVTYCRFIGPWLGQYKSKKWANIGRWPSNGPRLQKLILISCWPNAGPTFQCFNIIPRLEIKHRGNLVIHMSPQHIIFNIIGPLQQSLILNNSIFICMIECENMVKTYDCQVSSV